MPTVIYDPTGSSPDNLILNEIHTPVTEPDIFPTEGAFYTADFSAVGLRASDGTPVTLQLYVDYIWSPLFSTRAAGTGREVFSYILLTNYTEWSTVTLNYRAVGGDPDNVLLGQIVTAGAFDRTNIDNWLAFQGEAQMLNPAGVDFTLKNTGVAYLFSSKLNSIAAALRTPSSYLEFINTDYLSLSSNVSTLSAQVQAWQSDMLNGSFASMSQVNSAITAALSGFSGGNSLPLTGGTMNAAANITMNGGTILGLTSNSLSPDAAASQGFVLEHASSSNVSGQAVVRSTANLIAIYANGTLGVGATLTNNDTFAALAIDGHTCATGEEVLIMDQTDPIQNGHYVVTIAGDGATAWVLTRTASLDNHTAGQVKAGAIIIVTGGTTHAGTSWTITSAGTGVGGAIILGTDSVVFGPFNITINLAGYVTDSELTTSLANYATHAELSSVSGSSVPFGTILPFTGSPSAIPVGFLQCPTAPSDLLTSAYPDLYAAVGNNWQNSTWLPEDIENYASCRLSDNRILICGGTIGGVASKAVYFGTISGDDITWVKSLNVLPRTMTEHTAVTLSNGYVWLAGGWINDVDNPYMGATSCPTYLLNITGNTFSIINSGNLKGSGGGNLYLRGHAATLVNHGGVDQVMVSGGFTSTIASGTPVANVRFYTFNGSWVVQNAKDGTSMPVGLANHKVISLAVNKVMVLGGVITNRATVEQVGCRIGTLNVSPTNYSITWTQTANIQSNAIEQQAIRLSDGKILVMSCGDSTPVSHFGTLDGGLTSVTWTVNTNPTPAYGKQITLIQHVAGKVTLVGRKSYVGSIGTNSITWTSDKNSTIFGLPWFPVGYVPVQNPSNIGQTTIGDLMAHTHVDTNHLKFNNATIASNFSWGASTANIGSFVVDKSANLPAGQGVQFIIKY